MKNFRLNNSVKHGKQKESVTVMAKIVLCPFLHSMGLWTALNKQTSLTSKIVQWCGNDAMVWRGMKKWCVLSFTFFFLFLSLILQLFCSCL